MKNKHILFSMFFIPFVAMADCTNLPVEFYGGYVTTTSEYNTLNGYIIIKNLDNVEHTITEVNSADPNARNVSFQNFANNSVNDNAVLENTGNVFLPPHSTLLLTPNSSHLVLNGYRDPPVPGDTVTLIFDFEGGCRETIKGIPVIDGNDDP